MGMAKSKGKELEKTVVNVPIVSQGRRGCRDLYYSELSFTVTMEFERRPLTADGR